MSLYLTGEVNPLAVLGIRQVKRCPPHFRKIPLDNVIVLTSSITDWIWLNLSGRFYIGYQSTAKSRKENDSREELVAAFEIHSEATHFALILPTII